jgi:type VI secretion system protein ImpM
MRCGLYGKLPTKRDFIALNAPRDFLAVWEPWIQSAMAASRQSLGDTWMPAFLTAPIWRFWLGADLCETTVVGAFMPSLDGIGRYFPLTLFACADESKAMPPPEIDPQDDWFAAAEHFLLSILDDPISFEETQSALDDLRFPAIRHVDRRPDEPAGVFGNSIAKVGQRALPETFAAMRLTDHAAIYSAATFWWTMGGEGYEPMALGGRRMPSPYLFSAMLSGRFESGCA